LECSAFSSDAWSIRSRSVLARLNETIDATEAGYRDYQFNTVAQRLYDFVWSDYCDWFVEAAKTDIFGDDQVRKNAALATMDYISSAILRLLHPFMPHITEELWMLMGFAKDKNLFLDFAALPARIDLGDEDRLKTAQSRVHAIYALVEAGRNLRAEAGVPSNRKARFMLRSDAAWLQDESLTIARLLNAESLEINPKTKPPTGSSLAAVSLGELSLVIDKGDRAAERERLEKEIAKLEADLKSTEAKLANTLFVERAPKSVVQEHEQRRDDFRMRLTQLRQARASLG
jgi:valyl-tRNA synthetase